MISLAADVPKQLRNTTKYWDKCRRPLGISEVLRWIGSGKMILNNKIREMRRFAVIFDNNHKINVTTFILVKYNYELI